MNWFTFSLLSITALATAELLQQKLLNDDNEIDPRSSAVITFGIQTLLALPIIYFFGLGKYFLDVFDKDVFGYLLLTSFTASIAMVFYLKSFMVKNISFSSMLISFSVVVSTILGTLIFNEVLSWQKLVGITLILLAIVSLNYKNVNLEKNHLFGLLAGLFFGVTYTFDKLVVLETHPMIYLFWSFLFVVLLGFAQNPKSVILASKKLRKVDLKHLLISGSGYFVYNICTFFAYSVGGEVGRVDAINNSQVFLIILVEYFILNQKKDMVRKIITAIVAFAGVYILGNF